MLIKDKYLNKNVNVRCKECVKYSCYWPRPDPGIFTQGQGYKKSVHDRGWLCGTREVRGCPEIPEKKTVNIDVK